MPCPNNANQLKCVAALDSTSFVIRSCRRHKPNSAEDDHTTITMAQAAANVSVGGGGAGAVVTPGATLGTLGNSGNVQPRELMDMINNTQLSTQMGSHMNGQLSAQLSGQMGNALGAGMGGMAAQMGGGMDSQQQAINQQILGQMNTQMHGGLSGGSLSLDGANQMSLSGQIGQLNGQIGGQLNGGMGAAQMGANGMQMGGQLGGVVLNGNLAGSVGGAQQQGSLNGLSLGMNGSLQGIMDQTQMGQLGANMLPGMGSLAGMQSMAGMPSGFLLAQGNSGGNGDGGGGGDGGNGGGNGGGGLGGGEEEPNFKKQRLEMGAGAGVGAAGGGVGEAGSSGGGSNAITAAAADLGAVFGGLPMSTRIAALTNIAKSFASIDGLLGSSGGSIRPDGTLDIPASGACTPIQRVHRSLFAALFNSQTTRAPFQKTVRAMASRHPWLPTFQLLDQHMRPDQTPVLLMLYQLFVQSIEQQITDTLAPKAAKAQPPDDSADGTDGADGPSSPDLDAEPVVMQLGHVMTRTQRMDGTSEETPHLSNLSFLAFLAELKRALAAPEDAEKGWAPALESGVTAPDHKAAALAAATTPSSDLGLCTLLNGTWR
jgi:hypothetical protein